uniref:Uncharacterized protein n=1 Tax=Sinocyclocheilus grahami TaxID=75366 RepID=A0A672R4C0_SINGR
MRPWTGSWRWIMLVLLAWGTLLFYIGGHLVRESEHPERSSRELSKILAKLESSTITALTIKPFL